jgi:Zn-dependent protease
MEKQAGCVSFKEERRIRMDDFLKRGVTVRLLNLEVSFHWSLLLIALDLFYLPPDIVLFFLSVLCSLFIVLVHEFGHYFFCNRFGYAVHGILVHYWGGLCSHDAPYHRREAIWITAGGVIFEAALLILALVLYIPFGALNPYLSFILLQKLVFGNLFIMGFNLLPIPGFDGHEFFSLVGFYLPLRVKTRHNRDSRIKPDIRAKPVTEKEAASEIDDILRKARDKYGRGE